MLAIAGKAGSFASQEAEITAFVETDVMDVLKARNVAADDMDWPRQDILLPSLEAIRYSQLRFAFANLLASSMDRRRAPRLLPAYVDILKQLSHDEAQILLAVPAPSRVFPAADLVFQLPSREVAVAYRHLVPRQLADVCACKDNIPQYVDNLIRLSLVHQPSGLEADAQAYRDLSTQAFIEDLRRLTPPGARFAMEKRTLGLTNLGAHFREACLIV